MFDIIIIGSGIAGLTAALYGARAGKSILLLESNSFGGQIINSNVVENYPGFNSIDGFSLMKNLFDQVMEYDVTYKVEEVIELIDKNSLRTSNGIYNGKTIIIASGLNNRTLGIEDKYVGRGVSYCASCDGNFFRNRDVAVIGGGNTAFEDVLYLSNIVNKIYLINRRNEFRAEDYLVNKVKVLNNVEIITPANVISINGDNLISSIELDNGRVIEINGLFLAIGKIPNTKIYQDLINLDDDGYVVSDDCNTNIDNIFVAGDIRTKSLRQLVTAASDGAIAANLAINYLNKIDI